ncbi:hypothetical protein SNEBB_002348 [Seison nebaliae]|nr:hypothetical protein SNEBB_002348 [Seison nebaliae]
MYSIYECNPFNRRTINNVKQRYSKYNYIRSTNPMDNQKSQHLHHHHHCPSYDANDDKEKMKLPIRTSNQSHNSLSSSSTSSNYHSNSSGKHYEIVPDNKYYAMMNKQKMISDGDYSKIKYETNSSPNEVEKAHHEHGTVGSNFNFLGKLVNCSNHQSDYEKFSRKSHYLNSSIGRNDATKNNDAHHYQEGKKQQMFPHHPPSHINKRNEEIRKKNSNKRNDYELEKSIEMRRSFDEKNSSNNFTNNQLKKRSRLIGREKRISPNEYLKSSLAIAHSSNMFSDKRKLNNNDQRFSDVSCQEMVVTDDDPTHLNMTNGQYLYNENNELRTGKYNQMMMMKKKKKKKKKNLMLLEERKKIGENVDDDYDEERRKKDLSVEYKQLNFHSNKTLSTSLYASFMMNDKHQQPIDNIEEEKRKENLKLTEKNEGNSKEMKHSKITANHSNETTSHHHNSYTDFSKMNGSFSTHSNELFMPTHLNKSISERKLKERQKESVAFPSYNQTGKEIEQNQFRHHCNNKSHGNAKKYLTVRHSAQKTQNDLLHSMKKPLSEYNMMELRRKRTPIRTLMGALEDDYQLNNTSNCWENVNDHNMNYEHMNDINSDDDDDDVSNEENGSIIRSNGKLIKKAKRKPIGKNKLFVSTYYHNNKNEKTNLSNNSQQYIDKNKFSNGMSSDLTPEGCFSRRTSLAQENFLIDDMQQKSRSRNCSIASLSSLSSVNTTSLNSPFIHPKSDESHNNIEPIIVRKNFDENHPTNFKCQQQINRFYCPPAHHPSNPPYLQYSDQSFNNDNKYQLFVNDVKEQSLKMSDSYKFNHSSHTTQLPQAQNISSCYEKKMKKKKKKNPSALKQKHCNDSMKNSTTKDQEQNDQWDQYPNDYQLIRNKKKEKLKEKTQNKNYQNLYNTQSIKMDHENIDHKETIPPKMKKENNLTENKKKIHNFFNRIYSHVPQRPSRYGRSTSRNHSLVSIKSILYRKNKSRDTMNVQSMTDQMNENEPLGSKSSTQVFNSITTTTTTTSTTSSSSSKDSGFGNLNEGISNPNKLTKLSRNRKLNQYNNPPRFISCYKRYSSNKQSEKKSDQERIYDEAYAYDLSSPKTNHHNHYAPPRQERSIKEIPSTMDEINEENPSHNTKPIYTSFNQLYDNIFFKIAKLASQSPRGNLTKDKSMNCLLHNKFKKKLSNREKNSRYSYHEESATKTDLKMKPAQSFEINSREGQDNCSMKFYSTQLSTVPLRDGKDYIKNNNSSKDNCHFIQTNINKMNDTYINRKKKICQQPSADVDEPFTSHRSSSSTDSGKFSLAQLDSSLTMSSSLELSSNPTSPQKKEIAILNNDVQYLGGDEMSNSFQYIPALYYRQNEKKISNDLNSKKISEKKRGNYKIPSNYFQAARTSSTLSSTYSQHSNEFQQNDGNNIIKSSESFLNSVTSSSSLSSQLSIASSEECCASDSSEMKDENQQQFFEEYLDNLYASSVVLKSNENKNKKTFLNNTPRIGENDNNKFCSVSSFNKCEQKNKFLTNRYNIHPSPIALYKNKKEIDNKTTKKNCQQLSGDLVEYEAIIREIPKIKNKSLSSSVYAQYDGLNSVSKPNFECNKKDTPLNNRKKTKANSSHMFDDTSNLSNRKNRQKIRSLSTNLVVEKNHSSIHPTILTYFQPVI